MTDADPILRVCEGVIERISNVLANEVKDGQKPKLDRGKFDAIQSEAFSLAKILAQMEAARAFCTYAKRPENSKNDGLEQGLARIYLADFVKTLNQAIFGQEARFGLEPDALSPCRAFVSDALQSSAISRSAQAVFARVQNAGGTYGLDEDHETIRSSFARFAEEKIAPLAEEIHRKDRLIPENLLQALGELGVFGISIPEKFGGNFIDHQSMIIATEELSIASLGAGGSVITRPEICAKALLNGGTEEQKRKWLPEIASGERMVCVAVTEPNAGSDVANVRLSAKKVGDGYVLNGEKTWCTFAGRADLFILLARTGGEGYKGLTLFLVEKPARTSEEPSDALNNEYAFSYTQPGGGKIIGHAISTIGYRGMHSFSVAFEQYYVPDANRLGKEGEGFILQMKGFAGGRIQTAARALGVMEAAFRAAVRYAKEREVFGSHLCDLPLTQEKIARMAARIQAGRQSTYHIAKLMDEGKGEREASLAKLLTCSDSEWVTREAMQIHGGMGYSEEYAVSRYFADARVLSIFEGAEEVLALSVIARQKLSDLIEAGFCVRNLNLVY